MIPRIVHGPVGVPLFAIAFGFWLLLELGLAMPDRIPVFRQPCHRFLCKPHSLLQAHALWHVLDAVSFALLYPYLRSERSAGHAEIAG